MAEAGISRRTAVGALTIAALGGCAGRAALARTTGIERASSGTDARSASAASFRADATRMPGASAEADADAPLREILARMTLDERIAQLFFVTPEQLEGVEAVLDADDATLAALETMPVGGVAYFARNIESESQLRDLLAGTRTCSARVGAGVPAFLAVDEEGGPLVARVAKSGVVEVETFPAMAEIGATGDPAQAAHVGATIGGYLHDLGFSVDFAPCADVLTNPDNTAIGTRSFGSDPQLVADMVAAECAAMLAAGTLPCAKHFPGHGDTLADSHTGEAVSGRTAEELRACEYLPFAAAIGAGCPLMMVAHVKTPNATDDGLPATLSPAMITGVLRGELGFDGVVVSDSFSMGAITEYYGPAEAAVAFLQAGGDMVLMPDDLHAAYEGVRAAVADGTLSRERVDESILRILRAKRTAGLLG